MTERKFARGLLKASTAAELRQTVSQVVRETAVLNKPLLVEPIDFEGFIVKNRTVIQNDPHRELLLYPANDVQEIVQPKTFRTTIKDIPTVPEDVIVHGDRHLLAGGQKQAKNGNSAEDSGGDGGENGQDSSKRDTVGSPALPPPLTHSGSFTTSHNNGILLTRQSLKTYSNNNHLIQYKYEAYSGSSADIPKPKKLGELKPEIYEVDIDVDQVNEEMVRSQSDTVAKEGFLFKGPDTSSDRMFAHIGSKSFKRRYCYLRQEIDGTYILDIHKDDKQTEAKATIVMDFCQEVVHNSKRGRFCFELRMTEGHKSFTLAADSESDMQDWLSKLQSVLQQNKLQDDKNSALERTNSTNSAASANGTTNGGGGGGGSTNGTTFYGTLKGLDQSLNPQLIKYSRETDTSIAQARRDNRRQLFSILQYYQLQRPAQQHLSGGLRSNLDVNRESFGKRILATCECLEFRLKGLIDEGSRSHATQCHQVEPYITSMALYDARHGKKLTENFYFDLNHEEFRKHVKYTPKSPEPLDKLGQHNNNNNNAPSYRKAADEFLSKLPEKFLTYPNQAMFNLVAPPHPDIFIVVRIDKILQGNINQVSEPYLKTTKPDHKSNQKLLKNIKMYTQKIGHFRMPFAWAARPVYRMYSHDLDETIDFPAIYRQEMNKMRDEDLLKLLADYKKPEKFSKLTVIPGDLKIRLRIMTELPNNCLTTSLRPLDPFPMPPVEEPVFEMNEFIGTAEKEVQPFSTFINHLFVYPTSLLFDSQKAFNRARNIAVVVELRDSDAENAVALSCIYGRPGQPTFVRQLPCPVLHHNTTPTWYEEIKMELPLQLTHQHHLLFSFVHVSCNLSKKKDNVSLETPVGYAWLPLLNKGRLNIEEHTLSVASYLPPGYLAIQPLGLGRGNAGPEIAWIDNQRPLFNVSFRLDSTVLTTDQHLHNLFAHAERLLAPNRLSVVPAESETCKILKASHAIQVATIISYLPTILDELFILLVHTTSEDIGLNIVRLLINLIHIVAEDERKDLLINYVKNTFHAPSYKKPVSQYGGVGGEQSNTVHGELCRHLPTILHPNNTDFLVVNKFMKYSGIIFDIIIKSMAQHLLATGRIKMQRNERFPQEYHGKIEELFSVLLPYIISRHKDSDETQFLNRSLAIFVKKCITLMDRGFAFRLIRMYMDRFAPGDPRTLQEFKFNFLQEIFSHEHFVSLNLPIILKPKNRAELLQHFTLSEEYCRQHFLSGLLLQEVKSSLNEICHIRKIALSLFKDLLAKHDLDDRYQLNGLKSRIVLLYVPWLSIVVQNVHRIPESREKMDKKFDTISVCTHRMSTSGSLIIHNTPNGNNLSQAGTPKTKNRFTIHLDHSSPLRASAHLKDTNYFAAIAGQKMSNGTSSASINSDASTISQETTVIRNADETSKRDFSHNRSVSVVAPQLMPPRNDKFTLAETKDILTCFLFIVKHMSVEQMVTWWKNCSEEELRTYFTVLGHGVYHFQYLGKKNVMVESPSESRSLRSAGKASTLPARMMPPSSNSTSNLFDSGTMTTVPNRENLADEIVRSQSALIESNLATEIGLIILESLGTYCNQFKSQLMDSPLLAQIVHIYLRFLELGQSETLSKHVFASLRSFLNNFSPTLFKGSSTLCGQFVYELLKCCDSRLATMRHEASAVLYLLMRSNFEFSGRKGLTRVHLQVIISVSQMIGNVIGLNNARFQESLSIINSYASSDKVMKGTGFPGEVKDLTKRVRTVLMATAQMQAHQTDPERLLELQYSLANSYASTPELRHTWLITMARNHEQNLNLSEAALCHLHIAALMAEYLKLKGIGQMKSGAIAFHKICRNIPRDEKGLKLDAGAQDSQYTEQSLLEQLKRCAEYLDKAERYECLGELYRLIIPIYEHRRDYLSLAASYEHLSAGYNKVLEVNRTGRRMLGRFYRIAFYGQAYFEEDHGKDYIYKEPKITSLSEISERLQRQYGNKFGAESVKIIMDSCPVVADDLDPKLAHIQVTHCIPYFVDSDDRRNDFEQNHDVDSFIYETPFTKGGSARGAVCDQWKRKTIIRTEYSFPYVLTRIPIKTRKAIEIGPIEVAIDELKNRIIDLEEVVLPPIDIKKLQLRLQGSVAVTVNAGPLAYANAFLDTSSARKYPQIKVDELKDVFRDFMRVCYIALQINERHILNDQKDYHTVLKENYLNLCNSMSSLMNESFHPADENGTDTHRNSMALFSAISGGAGNATSV